MRPREQKKTENSSKDTTLCLSNGDVYEFVFVYKAA